MSKTTIEPSVVLTICTSDIFDIKLVLRNIKGDILELRSISKLPKLHIVRKNVISVINELLQLYDIDTIILEETKLFLDKIDKYPDPYILNNVCLNYGLKISIEDNYYNYVKYIMEYSKYEWRKYVLGHNKYGVDLFKNHVLNTIPLTEAEIEEVGSGRYFEVLCMSDVVKYNTLLNKKYQINNE